MFQWKPEIAGKIAKQHGRYIFKQYKGQPTRLQVRVPSVESESESRIMWVESESESESEFESGSESLTKFKRKKKTLYIICQGYDGRNGTVISGRDLSSDKEVPQDRRASESNHWLLRDCTLDLRCEGYGG